VKKYLALGLVALLLVVNTAGCWNRREIETLGFVSLIGIDRSQGEEAYRVTFQIAKPAQLAPGGAGIGAGGAGGGAGEAPFAAWTMSISGKTVFDAVEKTREFSPRRVFFSHTRAVIIGEDLAREGIGPVLDFISREPELRRTIWVLVAKGSASEVLTARMHLERLPGEGISSIMDQVQRACTAPVVRFSDFLQCLISPTTQAIAPVIDFKSEWEREGRVGADGGTGGTGSPGSGGQDSQPPVDVRVTGAAAFRGDRLAGWFSPHEARGILWVQGKVRGGVLTTSFPAAGVQAGGGQSGDSAAGQNTITFRIIRARSQVKAELEKGKPVITVRVDEEGCICEVTTSENVVTFDLIPRLEKLKARAIENEMRRAIDKAQRLGVDVFGFGEAVFRAFPREWEKGLKKDWPRLFPKLEVKLAVDAKIRRTGMQAVPVPSQIMKEKVR